MKIPSEGKSHRRSASIHTTCECSDRYIALIIADSGISIHAAREGGNLVRIETHAEEEIAVITIRLRRRKCKISVLVYLKLK